MWLYAQSPQEHRLRARHMHRLRAEVAPLPQSVSLCDFIPFKLQFLFQSVLAVFSQRS